MQCEWTKGVIVIAGVYVTRDVGLSAWANELSHTVHILLSSPKIANVLEYDLGRREWEAVELGNLPVTVQELLEVSN